MLQSLALSGKTISQCGCRLRKVPKLLFRAMTSDQAGFTTRALGHYLLDLGASSSSVPRMLSSRSSDALLVSASFFTTAGLTA